MITDVVLDAFASGMYAQAPESLKTEVADLRTGEDGTVYASAGEAVRQQVSAVDRTALKYRGAITGGAFDDYRAEGYYRFSLNDAGGISDRPEGLSAGGILVNYNNFAGGSRAQYLYTSNGDVFARIGTNAFKEIPSGNFRYRGKITGGAFADYSEAGLYHFAAADTAALTDKPDDLTSGGVVVSFSPFAGGVNAQEIIDSAGTKWFRWSDRPFVNISSNYRGEIAGGAFDDYRAEGYYRFSQEAAGGISDRPEGLAAGGILLNYNNFAGGARAQYLCSADGQVYCRVGTKPFKSIVPQREVRYYALGDSITEGTCSENGKIGPVIADNYVKILAESNGYQLTNYGEGGSGWNHAATAHNHYNAKQLVDTIDFSGCDLVTLAYGVNDWHYNVQVGSPGDDKNAGTSCANMKYCIEKILDDNPLCKIIVLTPMNCTKYGGSLETNWGLGKAFSNSGTLQDVIDKEIEICKYYGIEYVVQSDTGVVNRANINKVLSDGIHPIRTLHTAIGKDLAAKINMK